MTSQKVAETVYAEYAVASSLRTIRRTALVYAIAIGVAEGLGILVGMLPSIMCHALLVGVLLCHYGSVQSNRSYCILPVLALMPLLRILSVTMPLLLVPPMYWYTLVGAPLLLSIALTIRLLGFSTTRVGLHLQGCQSQLLIAASGIPLGVIAFLLVRPLPIYAGHDWQGFAIGTLVLFIFGGFTEELLFRGVLYQVCHQLYGRFGLVWSSLLSIVMYLGYRSWAYFVFVALVSLFFGWCVRRTGSLWGVVLAHGTLNIILLLLLPNMLARHISIPIDALLWLGAGSVVVSLIQLCIQTIRITLLHRPVFVETKFTTLLRSVRRSQGVSFVELAQRTHLPVRLVAEIMYGLCPTDPEQLDLITQVLGVDPSALYGTSSESDHQQLSKHSKPQQMPY
jgi:uncharacterized protein